MSTQYPTGIDNFINPQATDNEDTAGVEHDLQHADANDAIKAIQTKLGITGSADGNSIDFIINNLIKAGNGAPSGNPGVPVQIYIDKTNLDLHFFYDGGWH